MTQLQALERLKAIFPETKEHNLSVSRDCMMDGDGSTRNSFYLWKRDEASPIVASSSRSWEHALAIAESGNEDIWPEQDEKWEDEVSA